MKNFNEYSKKELELIINSSNSLSEILRKLDRKINHGNFRTLKRYCVLLNIDISHLFVDGNKYRNTITGKFKKYSMSEILISGSTYSNNGSLKKRLYNQGLKDCICEKCGQNENWHGEHITLILDHINGIHNDNRIENLRILCPNCNATLSTNGGKNVRYKNKMKKNKTKKNQIKLLKTKKNQTKLLEIRKYKRIVERPSYDILLNEIFDLGYSGTGRKYGVSDNTIRKWKKYYEKYN